MLLTRFRKASLLSASIFVSPARGTRDFVSRPRGLTPPPFSFSDISTRPPFRAANSNSNSDSGGDDDDDSFSDFGEDLLFEPGDLEVEPVKTDFVFRTESETETKSESESRSGSVPVRDFETAGGGPPYCLTMGNYLTVMHTEDPGYYSDDYVDKYVDSVISSAGTPLRYKWGLVSSVSGDPFSLSFQNFVGGNIRWTLDFFEFVTQRYFGGDPDMAFQGVQYSYSDHMNPLEIGLTGIGRKADEGFLSRGCRPGRVALAMVTLDGSSGRLRGMNIGSCGTIVLRRTDDGKEEGEKQKRLEDRSDDAVDLAVYDDDIVCFREVYRSEWDPEDFIVGKKDGTVVVRRYGLDDVQLENDEDLRQLIKGTTDDFDMQVQEGDIIVQANAPVMANVDSRSLERFATSNAALAVKWERDPSFWSEWLSNLEKILGEGTIPDIPPIAQMKILGFNATLDIGMLMKRGDIATEDLLFSSAVVGCSREGERLGESAFHSAGFHTLQDSLLRDPNLQRLQEGSGDWYVDDDGILRGTQPF